MSQENSRFASTLNVNGTTYAYYPVSAVAGSEQLPYSLTVLLENVLRNAETPEAAEELAARIVEAGRAGVVGSEIEFSPARVLFQDFTGVPVFVDFAVMREACAQLGGDPTKINPQIPCDLVIDHSVIADVAGCAGALAQNMELEFSRNKERYDFLKWSQESFENVRIVPPGAGICHQLNIEQFAHVTMTADGAPGEPPTAYFDTLVGTDSHTPTANGIGVLGWGVGGIEAEAAALGQPITTLVPKVVGVRLTGELGEGVAAMDVALSFAQMLRAKGVVGCFVECFGPGLDALSATQRTCISNMTPEYGSTCTLFPVDEQTLTYLRLTGRSEQQVALVEAYAKAQGFWNDADAPARTYAEVIEFDLGSVERSLAGPSRPHDRIPLAEAQERFRAVCDERGLDLSKHVAVDLDGEACELTHGALAIAAVTSCTTATDPSMMLAAGLVAKKAADAGLKPQPWVKCVLAPGSKATELLLERAGLLDGLRALGFYTCGFGCMSCIGNSGPILDELHEVAEDIELASVLWATATSRVASRPTCRRTTWRLPPRSSPTRWRAPWTRTSSTTRWERVPTAPRCSWPTSGPATRRSPRWWPSMWTAPCTRRARAACTTAMRPGPRWAANPATRSAGTTRPPTCAAPRTSTAWSASPPRRSPLRPLARWRCWATSSPPTTSRRRVPLPPTRPRPATWRSAAWLRPTSTPTARAAATTR